MIKNPLSPAGENEDHRKRVIKTIKAKADARRTPTEKAADWMTSGFGSMTFLIVNSLFFTGWLIINTGLIEGITPFDPFPFSLLTTIVSLEAIILAIFVLISQNRSMKVDDLREEIHLQINIVSEKEITKVMQMTTLLLEKHGIDLSKDPELKRLLKPISEEELERSLEKELL
jgi:uncharacterized membrane protein